MTPAIDPGSVDALLFDIDGTLVDTDDRLVEDLSAALQPLSFLFPDRDTARFARRAVMAVEGPANGLYALLDRLHLDELVAPATEGLIRFRSRSGVINEAPIPGVLDMLNRLKSRFPLGIVTARGHRRTQSFLQALDLNGHFAAVVTARSTLYAKPHPAPVHLAAKTLGVPVENCLMIGDTTLDIRAGVSAGATAVGVLCGFGRRWELERAGADLILETTPDLEPLLG